jgi:alanyl-tRNA synthetase
MGQAYPELVRAEALIEETLKLEETRFRKTLERGLNSRREKRRLEKGDMFDGDVAFTLYDTYGFPLDLTQDALRARGIGVDIDGFTDAMERAARQGARGLGGLRRGRHRGVWFGLREKLGATEFLGYETEKRRGRGRALVATARKSTASRPARAAPSSSTRRRFTASPAARSATPA